MSRSFWFVFRPVYVLFSLYLMGDIFYRWDGLMYIGSFSDFLPSVALIAISWSAVAVVTALLLWITIRSLEWIFSKIGCRITLEHMMVFLGLMFVLPVMYLMNKTYDMKLFDDNFVKQILLSSNKIYFYGMLLTNLLLTWSLRKRVGKFLNIIQERITPLVWLFIIITVLSLPVVAYHTLQKDSDEKQLHGIANSEERNEKRPNIIYVMFDAMNAKDMSVYGYHRDTTPFIKKWAQQASVFKRAQAASNSTAPSTASIMTGKRVWTHKRYSKHGLEASKSSENLGLLMKNSGYYNMAFIASRRGSVKSIGVSDGFDVAPDASDFTFPVSLSGYIDRILRIFADRIPMHEWIIKEDFIFKVVISSLSSRISETTKAPEIAFNKFVSLLENGYVTEPYFAYIHVLPPHLPYLPPASYKGEFDTSPKFRSDKSQSDLISQFGGGHIYPSKMQPSVDILRARYDEYIRYCDDQFKDFIQLLESRDALENTVIILSSDHGESFGHNFVRHGKSYLYEELTNIPLIIKDPEMTKGDIVHSLVEHIDIPATILDYAKIQVPSWMEGRSLVNAVKGGKLQAIPVYSMYLESNKKDVAITSGTIAVWSGDYKLVHYLKDNKAMLFNLKDDPDELNDLFAIEQETGQRLLTLIKEKLQDVNEQ